MRGSAWALRTVAGQRTPSLEQPRQLPSHPRMARHGLSLRHSHTSVPLRLWAPGASRNLRLHASAALVFQENSISENGLTVRLQSFLSKRQLPLGAGGTEFTPDQTWYQLGAGVAAPRSTRLLASAGLVLKHSTSCLRSRQWPVEYLGRSPSRSRALC